MNVRSLLIARSVAVIGGTAALVAGVTFAAFNTNTVTLADNQLEVSSDVLRISNGGAFDPASVTGFDLGNLQLGVESPKQAFYLQNVSAADLGLTVKLGSAPVVTAVDPSKVHVKIYDKDGATVVLDKTLAELSSDQTLVGQLDASATGNGAVAGTEGNYSYSVKLDADAATANPATITNIDLSFTGTPVVGP